MDDKRRAGLIDLLNTPSPTGFETRGQEKWAELVRKAADRVECDAYGNAWASIDGPADNGVTVAIEAHADEIGYMVKHVTEEGFLHIDRIGGSDWATARGRKLSILGDKGAVLGIIGNTAIHIRDRPSSGEKVPEVHQLFVDVGASNPEEVAAMGIRVGHPATYTDGAEFFGGDKIVGRALDNRLGGFIISEVVRRVAEDRNSLQADLVAMNCVQEEIGGFGARMLSQRLKPDVCLVLDVTHATDTPGIKVVQHGCVKMGKGPSLTHGTANHPAVVQRLIDLAGSHKVPIQHEASSRFTGTDTDSIYHQNGGIPSALISLPLRYMHSVVEVAHLDDVEKTIALMTAFVTSVSKSDEFRVLNW